MRNLIVLIMGIMVLSGCAGTKTETPGQSSFLGDYSQKLEPGTGEGAPKFLWIKPGVDFTKYDKVMFDYVTFVLADESEYKGIDANEFKKLADMATLTFVNTIKEAYPVVAEPAPDVLRVRVAITNLKQSSPGLSTVTSVIPVGLAISLVKKGASDSWTGSGATTAEMMVLDSVTNEVLGAGEDTKTAAFTERFSKWGSAEEAFKFWAERFKNRLQTLMK
ncbi:MAG: DUF3313 domain-containing protein [Desulforhopalus sp.]